MRYCQDECGTATVPGEEVPAECAVDADCPDGEVCVNGECVPMQDDDFPLGFLLMVLVVAAVVWYASSE